MSETIEMNLLTQALFVAAVCFVVSNSAERDSKLGDLVTITLPSVGPDVERNFGIISFKMINN